MEVVIVVRKLSRSVPAAPRAGYISHIKFKFDGSEEQTGAFYGETRDEALQSAQTYLDSVAR